MNVIARTSLFTGLAVLSLIVAVADADPWKIDANTNVSTALDSYSDNWVGGEAGTFTWATQFLGAAERQLSRSSTPRQPSICNSGRPLFRTRRPKTGACRRNRPI